MGDVAHYARIGRFIYGFQRACGGPDGLRAQADAAGLAPALAEQARALATRHDALCQRFAQGEPVTDDEFEQVLAAGRALRAALEHAAGRTP